MQILLSLRVIESKLVTLTLHGESDLQLRQLIRASFSCRECFVWGNSAGMVNKSC